MKWQPTQRGHGGSVPACVLRLGAWVFGADVTVGSAEGHWAVQVAAERGHDCNGGGGRGHRQDTSATRNTGEGNPGLRSTTVLEQVLRRKVKGTAQTWRTKPVCECFRCLWHELGAGERSRSDLTPLEGLGVIKSDLVLPRFAVPLGRQGQVGGRWAPTCVAGSRNGIVKIFNKIL